MDGTCARCGKVRVGERYRVHSVKAAQLGARQWKFSDLKSEDVFLCNRCASMGKRGLYLWVAVICGLLAAPLLAATILAITQDGFSAGSGFYLLISLALLAPAAWAITKLRKLEATRENGELAAVGLRFPAARRQGRTVFSDSQLPGILAAHPELQPDGPASALDRKLAALTGRASISEADLAAIRAYAHHLALEDWEMGTLTPPAICDGCGSAIPRDSGYSIGASLWCNSCADRNFGAEGLAHLQRDPNFFGRGMLETARAFAANSEPVH